MLLDKLAEEVSSGVGEIEQDSEGQDCERQAFREKAQRYRDDCKKYRHQGTDGTAHDLAVAYFHIFNVGRTKNIIAHEVQAQADENHIGGENYDWQLRASLAAEERGGEGHDGNEEEKYRIYVGEGHVYVLCVHRDEKMMCPPVSKEHGEGEEVGEEEGSHFY